MQRFRSLQEHRKSAIRFHSDHLVLTQALTRCLMIERSFPRWDGKDIQSTFSSLPTMMNQIVHFWAINISLPHKAIISWKFSVTISGKPIQPPLEITSITIVIQECVLLWFSVGNFNLIMPWRLSTGFGLCQIIFMPEACRSWVLHHWKY